MRFKTSVRTIIFFLSSLAVFGSMHWLIYDEETFKETGDTFLLEIETQDPRALLKGDYMVLRYKAEHMIARKGFNKAKGYVIFKKDTHHVGQFVRIQETKAVQEGEYAVSYDMVPYGRVKKLVNHHLALPPRFYFQEGKGKLYERATYAVFKMKPSGEHLLVGLADGAYQLLGAP